MCLLSSVGCTNKIIVLKEGTMKSLIISSQMNIEFY